MSFGQIVDYATGTNRLQSATIGGISYSLSYDANGAITRYDRAATGDDTFIAWNARRLPATIVVGSSLSDPQPTAKDEFRYGPDGARFYKRSTWDDGGAQRVEHTFYVGPFEELLTDSSDPSHQSVQKSSIGGSVLHVRKVDYSSTATESIEYLHRDHLGSVEAVTDAQGTVMRDLAYDPFGTRRRDDGSRELDNGEVAVLADDLRKGGGGGFTGHENLDRTGFVHMNGRVYDPRLGRFLSPDPVIQAPGFSQNWNRYSYVMNSPVSFTDPSGFITQGPMCGGLVMCMNPGGSGGGGGGGASSTYTTTSQAHVVNVSVSMQSRPVYGWVRVPVFNAQFSGSSIDPYYSTSYEWQRQQIDTSVSANAQTSSSAVQVTQQRTVSESGETDKPADVASTDAYLVGRPLSGLGGALAGHMYIVTDAAYIGDPNATVYSYGRSNESKRHGRNTIHGLTGDVDENTTGISAATHVADTVHWQGLANVERPNIYATAIPASNADVENWAERVQPTTRYLLPIPIFGRMDAVNSNSAAQAVANRAAGVDVQRPRGMYPGYLRYGFPGSEEWQRVEFE